MKLSLIVAYNKNRVIGKDGKIPWRIPEDLHHFKITTLNQPILMGRKTWESLPDPPLPHRQNYVLSTIKQFRAPGSHGVFHSVQGAVEALEHHDQVYVIGGAQIYRLFLPYADEIIATEVSDDSGGDTFFPELPVEEWRYQPISQPAEDNGYQFRIKRYFRS